MLQKETSASVAQLDDDLVREAINWKIRLNSTPVDDELKQDFFSWYQQKKEHSLAWQRISDLSDDLHGYFDSIPNKKIAIPVLNTASKQMKRRAVLKLFTVTSVTASLSWLTMEYQFYQTWSADYATAKGERRTVQLADGTVVLFNTDTVVDIRFSEQERRIVLHRGEIFITSGLDSLSANYRPLRVESGDTLFQAIGTRFLVKKSERKNQLFVDEGKVAIHHHGERIVAQAGDHYEVSLKTITRSETKNLQLNGWLEGQLVVDDIALVDFLNEVSRYRSGHLSCDPEISDLRLSGVFQLDNPDKIIAMLPRLLPVTIRSRTRWWTRLNAI